MSKVLIVTVGGSCEPIVTAVNRINADKVYFVCSEASSKTVIDEGMVCGLWGNLNKPNIATQCNLEDDSYKCIILEKVDDYNYCYSKCLDLIYKLYEEKNNPEIIVDYTGGTKSMSAGALLAATEFPDIIISIVQGERTNLIKVKDGTQTVRSTRINYPLLNSQKKQILKLIELHDYSSALNLVKDTLSIPDLHEIYETEFMAIRDYCLCLNNWDDFNHNDALEVLKAKKNLPEKLAIQLQNVVNSRRCLEEGKPIPPRKGFSRYEVVLDLLKNAERKAQQKKYDDAVGRLYRTTELLAQAYLKFEYEIDTSKVIVSNLPQSIQDYYKSKYSNRDTIELALLESYRLISNLNKETHISQIFEKEENKIMRGLKIRNYSILAHGFNPVDEQRYREVYSILIEKFVAPILNELIKEYEVEYIQLPKQYAPKPL